MKGLRKPGLSQSDRRARFNLAADLSVTFKPIGVVHSPYVWRDEAPRQPTVGEPQTGVIVLRPGLQNTLHTLLGFEYLWVLFWFNRSHGWRQQVVPPRDTVKRGIFATRSPDRPNPIGLSAVRVLAVVGTKIRIRAFDLLDGTPVLDLKPYIPQYDAFPAAKAGWVDTLENPGPDHRYS